jgi:hypothetical protein
MFKTNAKYKEVTDGYCHAKLFKKGDKVMVLLWKEIFQVGLYSKLR